MSFSEAEVEKAEESFRTFRTRSPTLANQKINRNLT